MFTPTSQRSGRAHSDRSDSALRSASAARATLLGRVGAMTDDELDVTAARVAATISAAQAELAVILAEAERRELHREWECRTIERFAGWKCQVTSSHARSLGTLGRAISTLPELGAAVVSGELAADKAVIIARVATPESDGALVDLAKQATVEQTRRICSAWRRVLPQVDSTTTADGASIDADAAARALDGAAIGRVVIIHDDDGVELRARFDHVNGALVLTALDAITAEVRAERRDAAPVDPTAEARLASTTHTASGAVITGTTVDDSTPTLPQRARAAIVEEECRESLDREQWRALGLLRMFERSSITSPRVIQRSGFTSEVVVHVPLEALLDPTDVGTIPLDADLGIAPTPGPPSRPPGPTPPATPLRIPTLEPRGIRLRSDHARLLVCDAGLHTVLEDATGDPLHLGRRTTSITPAQRRAVHARHQHCTWPGCTALIVQLHHRHHRVAGGHDDIENLVPLCASHHGTVHRRAITIGRTPDGALHFVRADGTRISSTSPFARTNTHSGADDDVDIRLPLGPDPVIALDDRQRSLGIDPDAPLRSPQWRNDHFGLGDCIAAVLDRRDAALRRTIPT